MSAPPNNKFASKPAGEKFDAQILMDCRRVEKSRWVKTAQRQGLKLAAWIRAVLDGELPPAGK